jgi:hypothetical protein
MNVKEFKIWRDKIKAAQDHASLDEIVQAYLEYIGEAENARSETYMETHERLDDEIMGYAHSRWFDIENGIEDD